MRTSIHIFSESGALVLRDASVIGMLYEHHVWSPDGATWIYGVVHPKDNVHPLDVVDALTALGVHVLPGVNDSAAIHPTVARALAKHGVTGVDTTHVCATKMHAVSGMSIFRPHKY